MTNIDTIRAEIVESFSKHWELNDLAHRQDHFEDVFQTGMHINDKLGYGFDPVHILFAAYFHDLFAWSRPNHHVLSGEFVVGGEHPLIHKYLLTDHDRMWVGRACEQHRASFKGNFYSHFCELINSADRGFPDDVPAMVERSRKYWLTHKPDLSDDERMVGVIKHIKEKFGNLGYARYPQMYVRAFGERLQAMRYEVDAL